MRRRKKKIDGGLVDAALQLLYLYGVWAWRANSGAVVVGEEGKRRLVRLGEPGTPDVLGVDASGRLFGVECKRVEGDLNDEQREWHEKAKRHGVRVFVVRSVSQIREIVRVI